jgi:hypothetical protein
MFVIARLTKSAVAIHCLGVNEGMDCFVASLLAMTIPKVREISAPIEQGDRNSL